MLNRGTVEAGRVVFFSSVVMSFFFLGCYQYLSCDFRKK